MRAGTFMVRYVVCDLIRLLPPPRRARPRRPATRSRGSLPRAACRSPPLAARRPRDTGPPPSAPRPSNGSGAGGSGSTEASRATEAITPPLSSRRAPRRTDLPASPRGPVESGVILGEESSSPSAAGSSATTRRPRASSPWPRVLPGHLRPEQAMASRKERQSNASRARRATVRIHMRRGRPL